MLASPWVHVIDFGFCVDFGAEVFVFTIGKAYIVPSPYRASMIRLPKDSGCTICESV